VCFGPRDAPVERAPSADEFRSCVERFAGRRDTNYRIPHPTLEPDLVSLINGIHSACAAPSDLGRWRGLLEQLFRETQRLQQPQRALSAEAEDIEQRIDTLEKVVAFKLTNATLRPDCQDLPSLYERKCHSGTGNVSCLALQADFATCRGEGPAKRFEAMRDKLVERREQVRLARRGAATLELANRKARRCLTGTPASASPEQLRLVAELPVLGEADAVQGAVKRWQYCVCPLADLECGLRVLLEPETCPTEGPSTNRLLP
jgi:hypothetical protein